MLTQHPQNPRRFAIALALAAWLLAAPVAASSSGPSEAEICTMACSLDGGQCCCVKSAARANSRPSPAAHDAHDAPAAHDAHDAASHAHPAEHISTTRLENAPSLDAGGSPCPGVASSSISSGSTPGATQGALVFSPRLDPDRHAAPHREITHGVDGDPNLLPRPPPIPLG